MAKFRPSIYGDALFWLVIVGRLFVLEILQDIKHA
jgi:hypothetical protein